MWAQGLDRGPAGLHACTELIRAALVAARQEVDKMDLLESIHDQPDPDVGVAGRLNRFEPDWARWRTAFHEFTSEHDGGVRLRHRSTGVVESYDVVNSRPAIDPHHWKRMTVRLRPAVVTGVFNRSVALRRSGTRLLRSGNPLTDALAGGHGGRPRSGDGVQQAYAIRPRALTRTSVSTISSPPTPVPPPSYRCGTPESSGRCGVRRIDILPPFVVRVWMSAFHSEPVVDDGQRRWLDRPYDKNARDRNYSGERLRELFDIFGGQDGYRASLAAAEETRRAHMAAVTDLHRRCAAAQAAAGRRMAVTRAQAQARSAAGAWSATWRATWCDTPRSRPRS